MRFLKRAVPVILALLVMAPSVFAESKTHKLTITSNVRGAQVQISTRRGGNGESGLTDATFRLPSGEYSIRVVADGYKPALKVISLRRDAKMHFELERDGQQSSSGGSFKLTVNSNTNRARVEVSGPGGVQRGSAGTVFNVNGGKHTIVVSADGYRSKTVKINMTKSQTIRVDLDEDVVSVRTHTLIVECNVPGADMSVYGSEGNFSGKVNEAVSLPEGVYTVEVSAPGYRSSSAKIRLRGDERIKIRLDAEGYVLKVRTYQGDSRIHISGNGVDLTGSSEMAVRVAPGTYRITASRDGFRSEERTVRVNDDTYVEFDLKKDTALLIISIPSSSLNKKDPRARDKIEVYDNGVRLKSHNYEFEINPGQHTIQIVSGGLMAEQTYNVRPGDRIFIEPVIVFMGK